MCVYMYSTTDDVFAWSKLVLNSYIKLRKRPDGVFFSLVKFLLVFVILFLLLVYRDDDHKCKKQVKHALAFVRSFMFGTSRADSVTIVAICRNDIVRLWEYSQMTLEQNLQLCLS
jgi:hypothetical protein